MLSPNLNPNPNPNANPNPNPHHDPDPNLVADEAGDGVGGVVEALAEMASQDQMENLVGGSNESANEAVAAQLSAFAGNGDSSNGVSIDVAAVAASGPLSDAILTDSYSGMVCTPNPDPNPN